nr:carbamoyltransferase HypF [Cytophagales bacterium]
MPHWKVHIEGQVQGVGFRPAAARLANERGISGEVFNTSAGVCIHLSCTREECEAFVHRLQEELPPLAVIAHMYVEMLSLGFKVYDGFKIVASLDAAAKTAFLSPDFGICEACQHDIQNLQNTRYFYPFTSCTQCGPRYSILNGVPFDRHRSTMEPFLMCAGCRSEYRDPLDRRFH